MPSLSGSITHEDYTEGNLNELGTRSAQEVVDCICDWCPGSARKARLYCTSLIVRAALPILREYSGTQAYRSCACTSCSFVSLAPRRGPFLIVIGSVNLEDELSEEDAGAVPPDVTRPCRLAQLFPNCAGRELSQAGGAAGQDWSQSRQLLDGSVVPPDVRTVPL